MARWKKLVNMNFELFISLLEKIASQIINMNPQQSNCNELEIEDDHSHPD